MLKASKRKKGKPVVVDPPRRDYEEPVDMGESLPIGEPYYHPDASKEESLPVGEPYFYPAVTEAEEPEKSY